MPTVNAGRRRTLLLVPAALLLLAPGGPAAAQEASPSAVPGEIPGSSATPAPSMAVPSSAAALAALFPSEVLGEPVPTPELWGGGEYLLRMDPEVGAAFERILAGQGRAVDDLSAGLTSVYAGDESVTLQALRFAGADAALAAEGLVPSSRACAGHRSSAARPIWPASR